MTPLAIVETAVRAHVAGVITPETRLAHLDTQDRVAIAERIEETIGRHLALDAWLAGTVAELVREVESAMVAGRCVCGERRGPDGCVYCGRRAAA